MDALTALPDHGELSAWLANHADADVSLILLDVDDLSRLNRRDGHEQTDALLADLGSVIQSRCGGKDVAARIGGDEFALGLLGDDLNLDQVRHEVEDIRARFRDLSRGGTLSIGVCDSATLRRGPNPSLLQAADDALAEAKRHGPQGFVVFRPHHR